MSLVTQISALATRIAQEFNSVRSEIAGISAGGFETGTSFPSNPSVGQTFFMTDEKVAYIYSGDSWLPMTLKLTYDGMTATQESGNDLIDGGDSTLDQAHQEFDLGSAQE